MVLSLKYIHWDNSVLSLPAVHLVRASSDSNTRIWSIHTQLIPSRSMKYPIMKYNPILSCRMGYGSDSLPMPNGIPRTCHTQRKS